MLRILGVWIRDYLNIEYNVAFSIADIVVPSVENVLPPLCGQSVVCSRPIKRN